MKNSFVYMFALADEYELPLMVADTIDEIADAFGFSWDCLQRACLRNSVVSGAYRIRKVDIREPEEIFNFLEYRKFCKKNNIKEGYPASLKRFRCECFGA